jgi:hypothetical protein
MPKISKIFIFVVLFGQFSCGSQVVGDFETPAISTEDGNITFFLREGASASIQFVGNLTGTSSSLGVPSPLVTSAELLAVRTELLQVIETQSNLIRSLLLANQSLAVDDLRDSVEVLSLFQNKSLACFERGLIYKPSIDACHLSSSIPECGAIITGLDAYASASCGLTAGSTSAGALCVATCNVGYGGGASATFTCMSNGQWNGSLSCPGENFFFAPLIFS